MSADVAALRSELVACAVFADGTRDGELAPLAHFTRHRIAKALRGAATALETSTAIPPAIPEVARHRAEDAVEAALAAHGIDPIVRLEEFGAPWLSEVLVRTVVEALRPLPGDSSADESAPSHTT